jgi:hypothetical protein
MEILSITEATSFIERLSALAKRIPREVFHKAGNLDCVTYVIVHDGTVIYVGEGLRKRATMQFETRGKNSKALDDFVAAHWSNFEVYFAGSNITKAVALAFEGVLIQEFRPQFNMRPEALHASNEIGRDTFTDMHGAERLDYNFAPKPPRYSHVALWKAFRRDEIPADWIITRVSGRPKWYRPDTKPHEITHFKSYPPVGGSVTVADHRARNEAAGISWNTIKSILHWDRLYPDDEGPIITITAPGQKL